MAYLSGLRYCPLLGSVINLAAFIVSLKLLLVSIGGRSEMEKAAIVTYNTSAIGQNPSRYPSDLASNVSALIPSGDAHAPSVTRYLGIADWYSLHYLATCQGYFGVDTSSGLLTSDKVNVTCVEQGLGYTFSLLDTVSPQLNPSVAGVTSDIPADLPPFETKPEAALLTLGIIWSGVEIALLVLTIRGILHLNISSFIVSSIAFLSFTISAGLVTGHVRGVQQRGVGFDSTNFLALTWAVAALEAVVFCLVQLEWRFEMFTSHGLRITCYWKPPEVDSWLTMRKNKGIPENEAYGEELHG